MYYDVQGRLTTINGDNANMTYQWQGALVSEAKSTGPFTATVDYSYDNFFRVTDRVITVGTAAKDIHFTYDADGQLATVLVCHTSATSCTQVDATYTVSRTTGQGSNGMLTGTSLTDGTHTIADTYGYDTYGAVTSYALTTSVPSTPYSVSYTRSSDPLGRITTKDETYFGASPHCIWTYGYGATYGTFLTSGTNNSSSACGMGSLGSLAYDADGNMTTTPAGNAAYDAQDRISTLGSWSYDYDKNGDLADARIGSTYYYYYYYDALEHLRLVTYGGNSWLYAYDAIGRRIGYLTNGSFTEGYVYDGDRVVATVNASGTLKAQFVYATKSTTPDLMIDAAGNVFRLVSDQVGSVRARVSLSSPSTVDEGMMYSPTGIGNVNPSAQPFGFAGGIFMPVGTTHFGARDYNPWEGKFWSKDPIRFMGGLNLYAYCQADPVNCVDPSGAWGFFGYGSLTGNSEGPVRAGGEAIGVIGYDFSAGLFGAFIPAVTSEVGTDNVYVGGAAGMEFSTNASPTPIALGEIALGPIVFGGFREGTGEWGVFVGGQHGHFGSHGSAGLGVTLPGSVGRWLDKTAHTVKSTCAAVFGL